MYQDKNKPFVAESPDQITNSYMTTPFRLGDFSYRPMTIVENHDTRKPLRMDNRISPRTGKPYQVYMLRVSDGFVEKNLEMFPTEAMSFFRLKPPEIKNLKGVTVANQQGAWTFIPSTDDLSLQNLPGQQPAPTPQPTAAQEPVDQMGQHILLMMQGMKADPTKKNDLARLIQICAAFTTADSLAIVTQAKIRGYLYEKDGGYVIA